MEKPCRRKREHCTQPYPPTCSVAASFQRSTVPFPAPSSRSAADYANRSQFPTRKAGVTTLTERDCEWIGDRCPSGNEGDPAELGLRSLYAGRAGCACWGMRVAFSLGIGYFGRAGDAGGPSRRCDQDGWPCRESIPEEIGLCDRVQRCKDCM